MRWLQHGQESTLDQDGDTPEAPLRGAVCDRQHWIEAGITCPQGDTAYNGSKAGVKVLTEALAHSLHNEESARITAHR